MQYGLNVKAKQYMDALRCGDVKGIKESLNTATVNLAVPFRAFEMFVSRGCWKEASLVVSFSNWDPNYKVVDGLLPEERAALHNKKELALAIVRHRNYNADFGHRKNNSGIFAEKLQKWMKQSKTRTRA
jgi:ankyrin repeat protein